MVAEKHTFEKNEEAEIEVEDMEVDTMAEMAENSHDISYRESQPLSYRKSTLGHNCTMDKNERLERVKGRMKAWEAIKICNELVKELTDGMERAVTANMMGDIVLEMIEKARAAGSMNILIKGIMDQGHVVRNQV